MATEFRILGSIEAAGDAGAIKLYERFGFRPYILGLLLSTE